LSIGDKMVIEVIDENVV